MIKFKPYKLQVIFIFIILFFSVLPIVSGVPKIDIYTLITLIIVTTLCAANFYIFYSFLIPRFFLNNRSKIFWIITVLFIIIYPVFWIMLFKLIYLISLKDIFLGGSRQLLSAFLYTVLFTTFSSSSRFIVEWFNNYEKRKELENKNIKSELDLLRNQISPHFLFNNLNNIHAYALVDPKITSDSIEKLSDILRYMLYEAKSDKVLLSREIDYLRSYSELINLKFKKRNFVKIEINGEPKKLKIAPMLFIPFVENAYKHGNKTDYFPGVQIKLIIDDDSIRFICQNIIRDIDMSVDSSQKGGIGLKNVKRRLDLLFNNKYSLHIENKDMKFIVKLHISELN